MEKTIRVRAAVPADAAALLAIYRPYVEKTAISFEWEAPTEAVFRGRVEKTLKQYPYLAAERGGEILGYAYCGAFVPRAAYDWTAETTIYLREDQHGRGLGRRLYTALENVAKAQGYRTLYACVGVPAVEDAYLTFNSESFHRHLGYDVVGTFRGCGYKFGVWYDMVWMEKRLGEPQGDPGAPIPFPELSPAALAAAGVEP